MTTVAEFRADLGSEDPNSGLYLVLEGEAGPEWLAVRGESGHFYRVLGDRDLICDVQYAFAIAALTKTEVEID